MATLNETNGTESAAEIKSNVSIPEPYISEKADQVIGYIYFFICIVGYVSISLFQ